MLDGLILEFDRGLRTIYGGNRSKRIMPGDGLAEPALDETEKRHMAGLMRVNHCGEVCAQALYQGQALVSTNPTVQTVLRRAAEEEADHLAWTHRRLTELGGCTSLLNPFWYAGALAMGMIAGSLGDEWNLGFLAETERQVEAHLDDHLRRLPMADSKSLALIERMRQDEIGHAHAAEGLGAMELPLVVRMAMRLSSKMMTGLSYRI